VFKGEEELPIRWNEKAGGKPLFSYLITDNFDPKRLGNIIQGQIRKDEEGRILGKGMYVKQE